MNQENTARGRLLRDLEGGAHIERRMTVSGPVFYVIYDITERRIWPATFVALKDMIAPSLSDLNVWRLVT